MTTYADRFIRPMQDAEKVKKEGKKYDMGKLRFDLLPPDGMKELVKIFTIGASKYGDRNWEKGMNWGRVLAAAKRHINDWELGEQFDPETGLPHLFHAVCNLMFLGTYELRGVGHDDLPLHTKEEEHGKDV